MKYVLKKPIKVGDGPEVTELHFREEVVSGDLRGIKFSDLQDPRPEDILKIAGRLSGRSDAELSRLSIADLMEVTPLVLGFFTTGLEIGKPGSQ